MVTATEWLKKSEAKRSKNPSKFKAVRRRAWDYVDTAQATETTENNDSRIWEQNKEQNGIADGINSEQNWEQSKNEIENNKEQNWEQSGIKSNNKYGNNLQVAVSIEQTNNRGVLSDDTAQKRILTLSGHQKEAMRHITSHIKSRAGTPYVLDILPNILAAKIKANLGVTRVVLKRLTEKNLLIRLPGERGRNGCCKFRIHENIVKICFSFFNDAPCDINQIRNEIGNGNGSNVAYSSSNSIINTTTALPQNWEQIEISSLSSIGFSKTQLLQLFEKQASNPDVIQESINHFAFGLENNPKIKMYPDPLNVFMGVLRKGGAWIEKTYISPKEKAMTDLLELKRREAERMQELEKKLIEEEFKIWLAKLDSVEKENILKGAPTKDRMLSKDVSNKVDEGYLLRHFKANLYTR
jgi:hypothetical protein